MAIIRTVRVMEGETVEIEWTLRAGGVHVERYTIPPRPVRQARLDAIGGPDCKATIETRTGG